MMENAAAILDWNHDGLLPPIQPGVPGNAPNRSPYIADLAGVIDCFGTSPERIAILGGLLRFRSGLHAAGITSGFQWLDGSFMENVEVLENRPPHDMDVVNFIDLSGLDQQALGKSHSALFDPTKVKQDYAVDAYFVQIGGMFDETAIRRVSYWYSMWSHRRDGRWKGFLQVSLDPGQDVVARTVLNSLGGRQHD